MDIIYIADVSFTPAVKELQAELRNIDGHMRWIYTDEKKVEHIIRPESTRPDEKED